MTIECSSINRASRIYHFLQGSESMEGKVAGTVQGNKKKMEYGGMLSSGRDVAVALRTHSI